MALGLKKTIYLGFIDDSLKDCYARFKPLSFPQYQSYVKVLTAVDTDAAPAVQIEQVRELVPFLKQLFVEGKILGSDGAIRDMTKEDLDDPEMPAEFFVGVGLKLSEGINPKS